ncbi:MAG: hypothetical protein ACFCUJ_14880 [Thiotrichales bacterium]
MKHERDTDAELRLEAARTAPVAALGPLLGDPECEIRMLARARLNQNPCEPEESI